MKQAIWLLAAAATALVLALAVFGAAATSAMGFAAVAAMAGLISATFLWLWWIRATPLALGMALSWAGVALVAGGLASGDAALLPLVALPLLAVGAVLHFAVMRRSMGLRPAAVLLPAGLAVAATLASGFFTKS